MRIIALIFTLFISTFSWGQTQFVGYQWNLSLGSKANNYISSSAIDKEGNILMAGQFMDTLQVVKNGATLSYISKGLYDCFMAKTSAGGQLLWLKTFGGVGSDQINNIHINASGQILLVGSFKDTINFSTDSNSFSLGTTTTHADMFVAKYDANGALLWAKSFGNPNYESESCNAVVTDSLGNVYTGGYFANPIDFNPDSGVRFVNPSGTADAFIQKLDSNGNFLNVVNAGINRRIYDMKYHSSGNIVFAGVSTAGSNGYQICVSMVRPNGVAEWSRTAGSTAYDAATDLVLDEMGNVYVTGQFQGIVTFGTGFSLTNNPAAPFIWKLNNDGVTVWVKKVSGPWSSNKTSSGVELALSKDKLFWVGNGYEINTENALYAIYDTSGINILNRNFSSQLSSNQSASICADDSGNAYLSLNFDDSLDVNLGLAKSFVKSKGLIDNVLLKMNTGTSTYDTLRVNDCNEYLAPDGKLYATTGKYNFIIPNEYNWDKYVHLDYTKHASYDIFLGIFQACNSYTLPDSSVINTNGIFNYRKTHKSVNGCDSIISLRVDIIKSEPINVLQVGGKLIAQQGRTAYQWLNCDKNYSPISGETKFEFEPDSSGRFAVIVTNGICTDTSDCYYIDVKTTGLKKLQNVQNISIYPNPNNGSFTLDFGSGNIEQKQIILKDLLGKIWLNQNAEVSKLEIHQMLPSGLYLLEIRIGSDQKVMKILVE
ncbi:MAG: T9SS type A sorting domain-containing protein [Bacteroidia bacterium]|nr:T9SS type A sorting domain-containing protein [Bacteroidia bacterium]